MSCWEYPENPRLCGAHNKPLVECAAELERHLARLNEARAMAEALVLSHEGHIAQAEAREAAMRRVLESLRDPQTSDDRCTYCTQCRWRSNDMDAIAEHDDGCPWVTREAALSSDAGRAPASKEMKAEP